MEAWKHGSMEVWKHGSMEAWKHGSMEAWKQSKLSKIQNTYQLTFLSSKFYVL